MLLKWIHFKFSAILLNIFDGNTITDTTSVGTEVAIPRSAWIEIVLFLAISLSIDLIFRDGTRFVTVSPHPFWIIVILISVQYGTSSGLLAVALSTLALLVGNVPNQGIEQDYYSYLFSILATPLG